MQRRRERRAAALKSKEAEEASKKDKAEEASTEENTDPNIIADEAVQEENNVEQTGNKEIGINDQNDETIVGTALEASVENMKVFDEVCPDEEYDKVEPKAKSICSVEFYPLKYKLDGRAEFRAKIKEYFENRSDVINKVIKCEVENYGNNVKLVTEMKMKRGWAFFYSDPEENYPDLEGVRTVRPE